MATQVYFRNTLASESWGFATSGYWATASSIENAYTRKMGPIGNAADSLSVGSRTGPIGASGVEPLFNNGQTNCVTDFLSDPIDQDVTISGTISFECCGFESSMNANATFQVIIERVDKEMQIVSTIVNSERGTELTTSNAKQSWTASPTSTAMQKGDRFRVRVMWNDSTSATMGSGFTLQFNYNAGVGTDADSNITFTETFGFQDTAPAGTQVWLTDSASPVNVGASVNEKIAWTSRGAGTQNLLTNCPSAAGWFTPIQVEINSGQPEVEWYTNKLAAFTLSGPVRFNVWARESSTSAELSFRCEIAVCDEDGTNVTIYGASTWARELTTGDVVYQPIVCGDDIAVSDGQRIRIRLYIDDAPDNGPCGGGSLNVWIKYSNASVGVAGDTWVQFSGTLTEFVASTPGPPGPIRRRSMQALLRR